jgi:AraC-like DNA-binding protein
MTAMPQDSQVSNTYFSDLLSAWRQYGHDKQSLIEGTGLSVSHIENPQERVSLSQFRQIMQNAVTNAGIDGFALRVGQQITPNAHGALGLAFLSSDTVDSALKLLEKYAATQTDLVQFSLQRESDHTKLVVEESRPLGDAYVSVIELALSTLWFALRFLSAGQLTCQRVHLRYPLPAYTSLYQDIFQCPIHGNQSENTLQLSHRSLSLPLVLANPQALRRALAQCEAELEQNRHQESLAMRIQKRLLRAPGHWPALPQLCEEFALSERTMRRRLDEENTSFQQLLNDTRKQLAERYLRTTDHTVHEIAWLLGYQDPSNFGNAFKRWHGMAPSEFRQMHAQQNDTDADQ